MKEKVDLKLLALTGGIIWVYQLSLQFSGIGRILPFSIWFAFVLLFFVRVKSLRIPTTPYFFLTLILLFILFVMFLRSDAEQYLARLLVFIAMAMATFLLAWASVLNRKNLFRGDVFAERADVKLVTIVFLSPIVSYIIISLVLFALGIKGGWGEHLVVDLGSGEAKLLALVGVNIERVRFYLSNGVNAFSPVAGLGLVFGYFYRKRYLPIGVLIMGVSMLSLLFTDGRGALLYSALAIFLTPIFIKSPSRVRYLIFCLIPLFPIALLGLITLVSTIGLDSFLFRGSGESFTLNGRTILWAVAWNNLQDFEVMHLFGYGFDGHRELGLNMEFIYLFANDSNAVNLSFHNSYLHLIFDVGYVGALVFLLWPIVLLTRLVKRVARFKMFCNVSVCTMIYFYLYANTEAVLSPRSELFYVFLFFNFCILLVPNLVKFKYESN